MNTARWAMGWTICVWILIAGQAWAQGSLTPPGPPGPTMKTLDQVEARIPITNLPYLINSSGSYYLTQNLTGSAGNHGIVINANRVTLDLNGFELLGVAGSQHGIAVNNSRSGILIRNGSVCNWSGDAVSAWNASYSHFEDLRTDGGDGDGLMAGENCSVKNCSAAGNGGRGFRLAKNSQIRDCVAAQNTAAGIWADDGAIIEGCLASTNNAGIVAGTVSIIRNCTVRDNATNGIQVDAHGTIADCVAEDNAGLGFRLGTETQIRDCTAQHNTSAGIWTEDGCTIAGCTATYNDEGIAAETASTIRGCTVRKNGVDGIRVSYRCTVADNTAEENGNDGAGAGIHATGNGNRITGNHVIGADLGLFLEGTGSFVADNIVMGNADNYNLLAGNELNLLLCEIPETLDWPCSVKLAGTLYCTTTGVDGISVNADKITIDLAGHSLIGPGLESGHAIHQSHGQRGLHVFNGFLVHWLGETGPDPLGGYGIRSDGSCGVIEDVHSLSNKLGFYAQQSVLYRCMAQGCTSGFSTCGTLFNCTAYGNASHGFWGTSHKAVNCMAYDNGKNGFNGCGIFRDCVAYSNGSNGFSVAAGGRVIDCYAYYNEGDGFSIAEGLISGCHAQNNGGNGISVIYIPEEIPSMAQRPYLLNNVCSVNGYNENDGAGIYVTSPGCRIEGNVVAYNDRGIEVESTGNFIARNTASSNTVNWVVAASNVCLVVQATPTAAAINGDSGGTAPGSTDPNANFTH